MPMDNRVLPPGRCRILNRAPQITMAAPIEYAKLKKRCPFSPDRKRSMLFYIVLSFPLCLEMILLLLYDSIVEDTELLFLFLSLAFGKPYLGTDITETDIRTLLILILPHSQVRTYIVGDIFP